MTQHNDSKAFAVCHPWDMANASAEKEISLRLNQAARDIGVNCIHIDINGYALDKEFRQTGQHIDAMLNVSFILHHHFVSAKRFDRWSVFALWNPPSFPYDWPDCQYLVDNYLYHDDYLTSSDGVATAHLNMLLRSESRYYDNGLTFYPSLPQSISIRPNIDAIRQAKHMIYIGTGWEKLGGNQSRHQSLLRALDEKEVLAIYGPQKIGEIKPWDGVRCYHGEIPFDGGRSVVSTINEAGVSLALSSLAHQKAGIMSNRVFESAAAGAVIITDRNRFNERHFGDSVLMVNNRGDHGETIREVMACFDWIRANPKEAVERARRAQSIYLKSFTLDNGLRQLFESLSVRQQQIASQIHAVHADHRVDVVCRWMFATLDGFDDILDSVNRQSYRRIRLLVICNKDLASALTVMLSERLHSDVAVSVVPIAMFVAVESGGSKRIATTGDALLSARQHLEGDLVAFIDRNECWFSDHLTTLVKPFREAEPVELSYVPSHKRCMRGALIDHTSRDSDIPFTVESLCQDMHSHNRLFRAICSRGYLEEVLDSGLDGVMPYIDQLDFYLILADAVSRNKATQLRRATCWMRYHLEPDNYRVNNCDEFILDAMWQRNVAGSYFKSRFGVRVPAIVSPPSGPGVEAASIGVSGEVAEPASGLPSSARVEHGSLVAKIASIVPRSLRRYFSYGVKYWRVRCARVALRKSDLWDESFYRSSNPTLDFDKNDPLTHFILRGGHDGLPPSRAFDSAFYLRTYADVRASGLNPLYHYLKHGRREGRRPHGS